MSLTSQIEMSIVERYKLGMTKGGVIVRVDDFHDISLDVDSFWVDEKLSSIVTGDPLHSRALHTAVPHCSHSRAPIVHTAVPRENNEHGCVYLRCTAVCKLPGCVEGHPWLWYSYVMVSFSQNTYSTWWRHQMETFSTLLAFCVGNSPVTREFPLQSPVAQSFDVFFDLRLE